MNQSQQPKKSNKKHTFILKNIDINKVDSKYGITIKSNLLETTIMPKNSTKIDDLTSLKNVEFAPFLDDSKKKCITMLDSITSQRITSTCCYWCRHPFSNVPVGCPLKYVPSEISHTYTSEITKEKYSITQKISQSKNLEYTDSNTVAITNSYYETDGSFCSFNCCMAYINSNAHDPTFKNSKNLLMKMYMDVFADEKMIDKINPAPSWRLLSAYGGFLSISEFRDSFSNRIYIDDNHRITKVPKVVPVGYIFRENCIF
jgi:hypothetical protein